jgi:hypothetical protein
MNMETGFSLAFRGVYFFNADDGYISGSDGLLIRTNDGGVTWEQEATEGASELQQIFFTSDHGFIAGFDPGVILTADFTGIQQTIENSEITVYPNPNKGSFYVSYPGILSIESLQLSDIQGKLIPNVAVCNDGNLLQISSNLQPGIYFLRIADENGNLTTSKVIIY